MIALLKLSPRSPLSNTIDVASSKRPAPSNAVTLFALKSCATPLVICLTTAAFHSFAAAKFNSGSAVTTPSLALISRAAWSACAVVTHALVGMQPTVAGSAELRLALDAGNADAQAAPPGSPPCSPQGRRPGRQRRSPWRDPSEGSYSGRRMVTLCCSPFSSTENPCSS